MTSNGNAPEDVTDSINNLNIDDQATEENDPDASQNTDGDGEIGESEFPPMYDILHGDDDPDAAVEHKTRATDLLASGDTGGALESLNLAVLASDPSPSLLTLRAKTLMSVNRHRAADRDASSALAINPDSARALRVRGRNRMKMLEWLGARSDLSAAQGIDFDEIVADDLKEAVAQVKKIEGERVKDKLEEEVKLRKRAEEIKKANEEAETEAKADAARTRADAATGGMPNSPDMQGLMGAILSDPELAAGLQNPKVMEAFSSIMSSPGGAMGLMSNPSKLQEMMQDPEVGPFMQKLMAKLGPAMMGGMGGMPGMPGGMGGMGGMPGGTSGGATSQNDDDLDDIPDLDDME